MFARILGGLLALSLTGNAFLYARLEHAKLQTQTLVSQVATDANALLTESLGHQATAYDARVAELQRRLEQSDAVTRAALARADNMEDNVRKFRGESAAQAARDPDYASWAATKVPAGVNDRLQELSK